MKFYYVSSSNKYNFNNIEKTTKSIGDIQRDILSIPNFCRDELSVSVQELKSYLVSGISFFTVDELNQITGLVNFDVNQNSILILGICVPGYSQGIGSFLISQLKQFAKDNQINQIRLTCYGDLYLFYKKQGFVILNEYVLYDSDDDEEKTKYNMIFNLNNYIGGKKKNRQVKKKT
jgi:GNAT superfamily N-acetyltransferase